MWYFISTIHYKESFEKLLLLMLAQESARKKIRTATVKKNSRVH